MLEGDIYLNSNIEKINLNQTNWAPTFDRPIAKGFLSDSGDLKIHCNLKTNKTKKVETYSLKSFLCTKYNGDSGEQVCLD